MTIHDAIDDYNSKTMLRDGYRCVVQVTRDLDLESARGDEKPDQLGVKCLCKTSAVPILQSLGMNTGGGGNSIRSMFSPPLGSVHLHVGYHVHDSATLTTSGTSGIHLVTYLLGRNLVIEITLSITICSLFGRLYHDLNI